jgi:cytoskeletal protein RodZ
MALSMDEQRMLAEIERRLAAEEPALAARLSSFRRAGLGPLLRSPRVRIVGSVFTVAVVAVVSLAIYAMVPLRATNTAKTALTSRPQASAAVKPVVTVPGAKVNSAARSTSASASARAHSTTTRSTPTSK